MQRSDLDEAEREYGGVYESLPRARRRREKVTIGAFEELFLLFTWLRAANADALLALFFEPKKIPKRTAMRRLAWLVKSGYLGHRRLFDSTRALYFLTSKGIRAFESVGERATETLKQFPQPRQAAFCWLRATIIAALVRAGFLVGRTLAAKVRLRRHLVDAQVARVEAFRAKRNANLNVGAYNEQYLYAKDALAKLRASAALHTLFRNTCPKCASRGELNEAFNACPRCKRAVETKLSEKYFRCSRCDLIADEPRVHDDKKSKQLCEGTMRAGEPLTFDLAWRNVNGKCELMVVLIDDPSRSIDAQLQELPLVRGAAPLPVLVRSADLDSIYDASTKKWVAMGSRHVALMRSVNPSETILLVDLLPELQFNVMR
jgi:hypothetical protein